MTHLGRAAMHVRRRAVVPALVHFPLLTYFPTQCVVVVVFREGIWFFSYSCILPFVAGLLESAVIRKKFEVGNQIQQIWRSLGIALKECKFSPSLSCFFWKLFQCRWGQFPEMSLMENFADFGIFTYNGAAQNNADLVMWSYREKKPKTFRTNM